MRDEGARRTRGNGWNDFYSEKRDDAREVLVPRPPPSRGKAKELGKKKWGLRTFGNLKEGNKPSKTKREVAGFRPGWLV